MNPQRESISTNPSTPTGEKVSFQDVVAYLHGVSDAMQAMQKSALTVRPLAVHTPVPAQPGAEATAPEPKRSGRLTLRHGEAEIEIEGVLVVPQTPVPLAGHATPTRGGARLLELEGAPGISNDQNELLRGTLPYWAPAVSVVPFRPFAGNTERPLDLDDARSAGAYSALALSLVPIAAIIPSGWPEDGCEERVSGVRLRAAPLSAELYALTGTDDWGTMDLAPIRG